MTDVRVPASGNIRVWWALPNAFSSWKSPTAVEINASLDISDSISWNDFNFALQASNTTDDPQLLLLVKFQTVEPRSLVVGFLSTTPALSEIPVTNIR